MRKGIMIETLDLQHCHPEKTIFIVYVDVGKMPTNKAQDHIEKVKGPINHVFERIGFNPENILFSACRPDTTFGPRKSIEFGCISDKPSRGTEIEKLPDEQNESSLHKKISEVLESVSGEDLIGVQKMTGPTGEIFKLKTPHLNEVSKDESISKEKYINALENLKSTRQEIIDAFEWIQVDPDNRTGMGVGPDMLSMDCEFRKAVDELLECFNFEQVSKHNSVPWTTKQFKLKGAHLDEIILDEDTYDEAMRCIKD